ncbi:MAG: beta-galactosidase trimerization domain-containing protein [Planctomycetes bacterium]|nr:beta-galactosidase trimerization domain-containing protein [Planctomycetota bacterium]
MNQDWLKKRSFLYWYDQYALNEQATAFSRYDPDRIAAEICATGAEIVVIYAMNQNGIAYYPSSIVPQHPNLKGRDYVADLMRRFRDRGKKIVLYVNWTDSRHPEWAAVRPGQENAPPKTYPLASWARPDDPEWRVQALPSGVEVEYTCPGSPRRRQMVEIAREICRRYHPDGYHIDMLFDMDMCFCKYCRATLEKMCGVSPPTREAVLAHWPDYVDWRCQQVGSIFGDVGVVLKEHGVLAFHNGFSPLSMWAGRRLGEEWLPHLDGYISECFDAFCADCTDLNSPSINARWQHATGKPAWMLRTSSAPSYNHWPIPPAHWRLVAAACKANGVDVFGPCGVGARPDTTTSPTLLEAITEAGSHFMADADLHDGASSNASVALLFSWATRKYYEPGIKATQWAEEFLGWARLLIEEHIPFDIVIAEDVKRDEQLSRYKLLILPNACHLADDFCQALRTCVRGGLRLIATAETSLGQARGGRRADFALGDVFGVRREGAAEGPFAYEGQSEPEPGFGRVQRVKTASEVLSRFVATDPAGGVAGGHDPLPLEPTDWPAAVRHRFGDGETLYVAFPAGQRFTLRGEWHIGRFMTRMIDLILPSRQLTVAAPQTVEVTLWKQPRPERTIIHLANRTVPHTLPTRSRQITEIVPVHDISLELPAPYADTRVSARQTNVACQRLKDNRLRLALDCVQSYAAVVLEPA